MGKAFEKWTQAVAVVVLCLVFGAHAQTSTVAPSVPPAASSDVAPAATPPASSLAASSIELKSGVIALPPEKLNPTRVARFDKPPVIDGKLDEEMWQHAAVLKNFYQTNPGDNIAPSFPTEALLGYDSKFLYLGFRCFDEPGKVRATVAKRDSILGVDDTVRILLDTFNDKRRAYVLVFNPFGIQQDGIRTEGTGVDFSVDIVMESKGVLTDNGYTVEVAIPFKSLRYEAGKGKLWGVQVFRLIQRLNGEQDSWMPISRSDTSVLGQAGHITGLEGISTERTLELIPSLTVSETGKRLRSIPPFVLNANPGLIDQGRFVNQPVTLDPGLTAKYSITPTITLDAAINPDFAQVEADQLVVTTNQRFPIFFPERRPFFLEGIEIFQTPLTALHTRAIVDPDVAIKLSGKQGRNSFGLLVASDNAPGNFVGDERLLARNRPFLDKNSYDAVIRLKRDVGKENNLGFIFTSYNFIQKHNQLGGFDGRFRLDKKQTFDFQVLGTSSRHVFFDPVLGRNLYRTGNGLGYEATYDYSGRNWGHTLSASGLTRDYLADLGFTFRTNSNTAAYQLRYFSDPKPKAKLVSWSLTSYNHLDFDFQRRLQIWESDVVYTWNFQRSTTFWLAYRRGHERLFEEEFGAVRLPTHPLGAFFGASERETDKNHFVAFFSTTPSKQYGLSIKSAYRLGTFDFDFGGGPRFPRVSPAALADPDAPLDPGAGRLLDINASGFYQPSDPLRLTLNFTKQRLRRDDTHLVAFDDNIFSLRGTYQFTRFVAARARIDYSSLSARARAQFLMAYTPNPGTAFFVGYNDDVNRNGFSPINGLLEPGFRRNGRTFFIKMSYLFRHSFS